MQYRLRYLRTQQYIQVLRALLAPVTPCLASLLSSLAAAFCRTSAFSLDGGFQYGVYDSGPSDSPALQLTKLANAGTF